MAPWSRAGAAVQPKRGDQRHYPVAGSELVSTFLILPLSVCPLSLSHSHSHCILHPICFNSSSFVPGVESSEKESAQGESETRGLNVNLQEPAIASFKYGKQVVSPLDQDRSCLVRVYWITNMRKSTSSTTCLHLDLLRLTPGRALVWCNAFINCIDFSFIFVWPWFVS